VTTLHESIHILGFDASLYSAYLDFNTGDVYNYPINVSSTLQASRSATFLLKTPAVTAWAKNFFNCISITGMQLEN
jgi:hypothetical protein